MAVPVKLSYVLGFLGKIESAYGTFSSPATTNGIQLTYPDRNLGAPLTYSASYDGDLGPSHGSLGTVLRAKPSGFAASAQWPMRLKGAGAAYSSSVTPNAHIFLLSSGLDGTVDATASSESWTYTPTPAGTTYSSHSVEAYSKGRKHQLKGGICSFELDFSGGPQPPVATFDSRYVLEADPDDASVPSITYALTSVVPPNASSVALVMGSLTTNAIVYGGRFRFQREIDNPRVALTSSGGHLGFVPGGYVAELEVQLEDMAEAASPYTASSGFDEYKLWSQAQALSACSITFGSTQYNQFSIDFGSNRAQVVSFTPAAESPVGKTTLVIRSSVSSPTASDGLTITFD